MAANVPMYVVQNADIALILLKNSIKNTLSINQIYKIIILVVKKRKKVAKI